jgi:2,3-bisphosphoglycerate-dependent phosphoglycerate mutase
MNASGQLDLHSEASAAINERDYGVYTGMNKDAVREAIGDKAYDELRRSWDSPVEGGESLQNVYQRTIPFYLRIILPRVRHGQNVLVIAHGNSIRSLVKYIENISDTRIGSLEMLQNAALVYEVDFDGRQKSKDTIAL